ncbi:MAG: alpha/beta hydrolase [Rhodobacteraceae bacterium]|nr:MAG: alpha/beta hydrolase [Paracoccaceae bacterium]
MELAAAPYLSDITDGPEGAAAYWARTDDGLRIRVGVFPARAARGTLLMFPGRTEYIEKYALEAADWAARGYAGLAIDWRGQGLADRLLPDARLGHVDRFPDYQRDVAAAMRVARALGLPEPFHLLGHSLGGAIALRAAIEGLPVISATFSGPMWGIRMAPAMRLAARALTALGRWTGQDLRLAPSRSIESYVATTRFEDNLLTTDLPMWQMMQRQLAAHPELGLGGPTLRWVGEAMRECDWLMRQPAPPLPALCFAGAREAIVDLPAMRERMARWPDGDYREIPGALHEVLLESPGVRHRIAGEMADLFSRAEAAAG